MQVINNLKRYSKEIGANEELIALIINSLEDWDNKMQIECAQSFIAPLKENVSPSHSHYDCASQSDLPSIIVELVSN